MLFFNMFLPLRDKKWLKLLLILLALFMGLIQSTRIIQILELSDIGNGYWTYFLEAERMDFLHYLKAEKKEPVFRIINYAGFYLFNGNFILFATELVLITYLSFYSAIYKFWKANFQDVRILIAAVVIFTFITENFGITNNLLRQQFAMGIMSYVIAGKVIDNKMNWYLVLFACFTHTLMFIFLPILFIKSLYEVIRFKNLMWIIGLFLVVGFIFSRISFFANLISFSDSISYALNRLDNDSNQSQSDIINSSVVYFNIALFLIVMLKLNYWDMTISKSQIFYTNIVLLLMIFCAVFSFDPMLQTRLYILRFFFIPFVIPLLFYRQSFINSIYLWTVAIFLYVRFFASFDTIGQGNFFPPIIEIISGSIFYFL